MAAKEGDAEPVHIRDWPQKECPCCGCCLIVCCLVSQLLVLHGNMAISTSLHNVGEFADGWSDVGLGLGEALNVELKRQLLNASDQLEEALGDVQNMSKVLDQLLQNLTKVADEASKNPPAKPPPKGAASLLLTKAASLGQHQPKKPATGPKTPPEEPKEQPEEPPAPQPKMPPGVKVSDNATITIKLTPEQVDMVMAVVEEQAEASVPIISEFIVNGSLQLIEHFKPAREIVDRLKGKALRSITALGKSVKEVHETIGDFLVKFGVVTKGQAHKKEVFKQTFVLYDTNGDGRISKNELREAGKVYEIKELEKKVFFEESFNQHAEDKKGLSLENFAKFLDDPNTPNATGRALGYYAKTLLDIGESLDVQTVRRKASEHVAHYLDAASSPNPDMCAMLSRWLVNGTVGVAFPADVLASLCLTGDADAGKKYLRDAYAASPENATMITDMMSNTSFWSREGFDLNEEPVCVRKVTKWIKRAKKGSNGDAVAGTASLLERKEAASAEVLRRRLEGESSSEAEAEEAAYTEALAALAQRIADESVLMYQLQAIQDRSREDWDVQKSPIYKALVDWLEEGMPMSDLRDTDPAMLVNKPTKALLRWLGENITLEATNLTKLVDEYMGKTEMDRVVEKVQEMVKQLAVFVRTMINFASSDGEKHLNKTINNFVSFGMVEALTVIDQFLRGKLVEGVEVDASALVKNKTGENPGWLKAFLPTTTTPKATTATTTTSIQMAVALEVGAASNLDIVARKADPAEPKSAQDSFAELAKLLRDLDTYLQEALKALKQAQILLVSASRNMNLLFTTAKETVPPTFYMLARQWKTIWMCLILAFVPFYIVMIYYTWWASGYCGGPQLVDDGDYDPPATCGDRMSACCRSFCNLQRECHDGKSCMFSWVFFMQLLVLILFALALIISLIFVFEVVFMSLCDQKGMELISSNESCTEALQPMKEFLPSFHVNYTSGEEVPFESMCGEKSLLVCGIVPDKLRMGSVLSFLGGTVVVFIMFELIIEFAKYHEMARMRRIAKRLALDIETAEERHGHHVGGTGSG